MTAFGLHQKEPTISPPDEACVLDKLSGIRWPGADAHQWARRFLARMCSDERVDAVVAIGSAIRGASHARSDVDFVLVYHGAQPPDFGGLSIEVDVRAYARDSIEQRLAAGHDVLGSAVRNGVPMCDRDGYWQALRSRWQQRLPLPSPLLASQRAERAERHARILLADGDEDAAQEQAVAMLTQRARVRLLEAGVFPASRPELSDQLREIGETGMAEELSGALVGRLSAADVLRQSCDVPTSLHR
jgi:hypothetical protein